MNNILIVGAGRSSNALIRYVLDNAAKRGWFVTVADAQPELAERKVAGNPQGRAAWLDVTKTNDRRELIGRNDLVVSLLPAHLHLEVAHDCIRLKKHLITASYVSQEMYRLGDEARNRELIFMGEMGLDPGVDHMSAMRMINQIKAKGGKLTAFRSYTGGLVAPESDDNPWHYKFSWNPRNVVLAGQGTAQYIENGKFKFIPYNRLFREHREVEISGFGTYEVYPNRDSLLYREVYGLNNISNLFRGTIRGKGFCDAWQALVDIGLTDADFPIIESENITRHALLEGYVGHYPGSSVREKTANMLGESLESPVMKKLEWLGLFRKKKIKLSNATPALILEEILKKKWQMKPEDKDLILMHHEFEYDLAGEQRICTSTMSMVGENAENTAMSKLVGLPMGIFVKLVMAHQIESKGVHIPVMPEVYEPVLDELAHYGVHFEEEDYALQTSV